MSNPLKKHIAHSEKLWDVIIVGQGTAGSTLAWALRERGQTVLIIDNAAEITSSKVAAGLITPITGKNLALSWRISEFLDVARNFYRHIEAQTDTKFFFDRTAIRLLKSEKEQENWHSRKNKPEVLEHLIQRAPTPLIDETIAQDTHGGFAMNAAQLLVPTYLAVTRENFPVECSQVDWEQELVIRHEHIELNNHKAHKIISCEGYAANNNPYFSWVPFKAAKGNILTIRFEQPLPAQNIHRGIWLAPTKDPHVFKLGATYKLTDLNNVPTQDARDYLETRLKQFIKIPYEVIDHKAAIRPIIEASKAVIGFHPHHPLLGYFNGLGSKGSLNAPWFATTLAENIVGGTAIPDDINLQNLFSA